MSRLCAASIGVALIATATVAAQITVPTTLPPTSRIGGNIRTTPPKGPVPRLPDGKPDMTGVWLGGLLYELNGNYTKPSHPGTAARRTLDQVQR